MKRCVVNFAKGGWYPRGQERLKKSLKDVGFDGDFLGFTDTVELNCPSHEKVPYAFKTYSLLHCQKMGYDQVIYADASIWAVKSIDPIWEIITKQGYFFEEAGHWSGTWTKDSTLSNMGVTRDEAMKMPMFSAGFVGIDFHSEIALTFLRKWDRYARDGDSFMGAWVNTNNSMSSDPRCQGHRHDMSVASILACQLDMTLIPGGTYLAYIGPGYSKPKETACFHLRPC